MPSTAGQRRMLRRSRRSAKEGAYPDHPALARRTTNLLLRTWATEAQSHNPDAGRTDRGGLSGHSAAPAPALCALFRYGSRPRGNNNESGISRRDEKPSRFNVIVRFYERRRPSRAISGEVQTAEVLCFTSCAPCI